MSTTTDDAHADDRIYIEDLARRLEPKRAVHTIRRWVKDELMPSHLRPQREGGRDRMYWVEDQIDGIQIFARAREERRGWRHLHRTQSEQGEN